MISSEQDASSAYPSQSPLPGGGGDASPTSRRRPAAYAVSAVHGNGAYQLLLEAYRPGSEKTAHGAVQKVFLDFDGERMNTNIFGGNGVSTLSPMSRFLPRWGLSDADEDAVIDATIASFKEDVDHHAAPAGPERPASRSRCSTAATTPTRSASRTSPGS